MKIENDCQGGVKVNQILLITACVITFVTSSVCAQMHEGGTMGQGMMKELQQGQIPSTSSQEAYPYMMGQGYEGHMMGYGPGDCSMMGPGGHMMGGMKGYGCEGHMMGHGPGGCAMMGPGGHMMGGGMIGPDIMGYGTEEEIRKLMDETVDLRRALHNKMFEMREAFRKPETTEKNILQLKKEMLEIKVQIYEKAIKSK
jgi:hypothetical protein